jgi:DNA-binding winged helix-turn-helix (wHTH) protein/tetratricopeptide (TPR) repeat protein
MDIAKHPTDEPLLTTADLAAREDLTLGGVIISPSTRTLRGPFGSVDVEPRVMQVLVVLADSAGRVVTRETLFNRCWGGVYVGDDSLNRAVAAVRRAVVAVGGRFEIETIPRTGYLLNVPKGNVGDIDAEQLIRRDQVSRRGALIGSTALLAMGAAGGLWWAIRDPHRARFEALMAHGDEAFRNAAMSNADTIAIYEEAVRLGPRNARALGLLAYYRSAGVEDATAQNSARAIGQAQSSIRRALAVDPKEPNALVAMLVLEGAMLDWATRDRRLREVLAIDPNNLPAMIELMPLLQAAGLTRESWRWNERILALAPLYIPCLVFRSLKLWIMGRMPEADKVMDRVRGLWPLDPFGYFMRFMLFALTDRPQAALAMIDSAPDKVGPPPEIAVWRAALKAIDSRAPNDIAAARDACLESARKLPGMASKVVMLLGALGEVDAAFEVTDGFLLWRGKFVLANQADGKLANDYTRRMTQWLFTPPVAVIRADPRFLALSEELGLSAYWRARGVQPDYQLTER